MKKDSYYFPHDYHARNDRKMVKLRHKFGVTGIGVYWSIIEMLYEENGRILLSDCDIIATELRSSQDIAMSQFCDIVKSVICDFDLFKNDGNYFWSESANRRLEKRLEKSEKAKESASHRWQNANGVRTHSERNAIKGNKRKGKEIDIYAGFGVFWEQYGKKIDKLKATKAWQKLSSEEIQKATDYLPSYIEQTPEIKFRKNPATYLNSKSWEDEPPQASRKNILKAVRVNEDDLIEYEDGSKIPPGSFNDLKSFKEGKLTISHFDRRIA